MWGKAGDQTSHFITGPHHFPKAPISTGNQWTLKYFMNAIISAIDGKYRKGIFQLQRTVKTYTAPVLLLLSSKSSRIISVFNVDPAILLLKWASGKLEEYCQINHFYYKDIIQHTAFSPREYTTGYPFSVVLVQIISSF